MAVRPVFSQDGFDVRCEWGEQGVRRLAAACDVVVIVDVLSFSTCVDVAVARGATVYPFRWKDERAAAFARDRGAHLVGPRGASRYSLSPASFADAPEGERVVLPSPNGATLCGLAGDTPLLVGCLRNASAVAAAARAIGPRAGVVPAGERWEDGSLRAALEDWLGAGAIVRHLAGAASPEARSAAEQFEAVCGADDLTTRVRECVSGRELIERGFESDVALACERDISGAVPRFSDCALTRGTV